LIKSYDVTQTLTRNKFLKFSLSSFLKIFFAVALVYWLVQSGKIDFFALKNFLSGPVILICLLLVFSNILLATYRWHMLLKTQGISVPFSQTFRLSTIGIFFNFAIPGGVGGDVIKAFYATKNYPDKKSQAVLTILMDRMVGLFTIVFMALVALLFHGKETFSNAVLNYILITTCIVFSIFSAFWVVTFSRTAVSKISNSTIFKKIPFGDKLLKLVQLLSFYKDHKNIFFKTVFISFLAQITSICFFIYGGNVLSSSPVDFSIYFFVVPIGFIVTAIPISPAGVGVGQIAFMKLFNIAQKTESPLGANLATAFQVFCFCVGLIGAYYYVRFKQHVPKKDLEETESLALN